MGKRNKGRSKAGRIALIVLSVVLVLVLLALGALAVALTYVNSKLDLMDRSEDTQPVISPSQAELLEKQTEPEDVDATGPELDPEDVTWATVPAETIGAEKDNHIINILLIGQDRRPGEGRARSDSMILCTLNVNEKTLTMTSFLRDLYVQIPGYQDSRLNHSYQYGGMPLLNETLRVNFGIHVDGNVEVDFTRFTQIIDLLGGVDIGLTEKEANHLNRNGWGLKEGMNHLNGEQALTYARIRSLDNDFGRTNRQRKVISALISQCRNLSLKQMNNVLNQVLPYIRTDLSNKEIIDYAMEIFPILRDLTITTQHIPAKGTYESVRIRGMSVLLPDLEANRKILVETLLEP